MRCTFSSLRCACIFVSSLSATNHAPSPRKLNFQSPLHVLKIYFHPLNVREIVPPSSLQRLRPLCSPMVQLHLFFFKVWLHLHFMLSSANCLPFHRKASISSFILSSLLVVPSLEIPQWYGCTFFFFFLFLSILTLQNALALSPDSF